MLIKYKSGKPISCLFKFKNTHMINAEEAVFCGNETVVIADDEIITIDSFTKEEMEEIDLGNGFYDISKLSFEKKEFILSLIKSNIFHKAKSFAKKAKLVIDPDHVNRKQKRSNGNVKKNNPYYQQFKKGKFYGW